MYIWFGIGSKLSRILPTGSSIPVGSINVQPLTMVRDLRVMIDVELLTCYEQRSAFVLFAMSAKNRLPRRHKWELHRPAYQPSRIG